MKNTAELTIEALFRDFAADVQKTANEALGANALLMRLKFPPEQLDFWVGHIRGALTHSMDDVVKAVSYAMVNIDDKFDIEKVKALATDYLAGKVEIPYAKHGEYHGKRT